MREYLEKHRFAKGAALLVRRYYDHHVGRDSAALTYYLLFAVFPLLLFLNSLIGVFALDIEALLPQLDRLVPQDVLDLAVQYLRDVSSVSSRTLLWFSLVFTFYFPYRAANALFMSVRKAYDAGMPARYVRYQLRVLLFTVLLIFVLVLSFLVAAVGRRVLAFVAGYIYLSDAFIRLWSWLRFVLLGAALFAIILLLYALALDSRELRRCILPGALCSLTAWIVLSLLFSLYVEYAGRYSVIYGSIGGVVVALVWLSLTATTLILGAEFNGVLLTLGKAKEQK